MANIFWQKELCRLVGQIEWVELVVTVQVKWLRIPVLSVPPTQAQFWFFGNDGWGVMRGLPQF